MLSFKTTDKVACASVRGSKMVSKEVQKTLLFWLITCILVRNSDGQLIQTVCGDIPVVVRVVENTAPGTVVMTLTNVSIPGVTDVVWERLELANGYVKLDTKNQTIILVKHLDAESMERLQAYSMVCRYKMAGSVRQGSVDIRLMVEDVNDNTPVFTAPVYYVNVSESLFLHTLIFSFKDKVYDSDATGSIGKYNIVGGGVGYFRIGGAAADGNLVLSRQLDYDNGPRVFTLQVEAYDNGIPPLTARAQVIIQVVDEDDLSPAFEADLYKVTVLENESKCAATESRIQPGPIKAYDQDLGINATVLYRLGSSQPASAADHFTINGKTGQLQVIKSLDRELQATVVLTVKAYQADAPRTRTALATVVVTVVDTNDNKPAMTQAVYNVAVPRNVAMGTYLTTVRAVDPDAGVNAVLEYVLDDPKGRFTIDASSGVIRVSSDLSNLDGNISFYVYARETMSAELLTSNKSMVNVTIVDKGRNIFVG
ncbi:protocadherin gamma-A4 [Lingula anatina]|uniref:Protocadherin gamma-A4 n=1 Tax=Lingula anatina TaxID=7574 RepID=A0A1S3I2K7_LINAN|nr:protocadherin gamma-A4 [Lingula anatina]|eukprot:XP_013391574.1 protocadherin gamma-A4 [Lingula anatina]